MITTTYTCDRCKAEQTTSNQMWNLRASLAHFGGSHSYPTTTREALWCRKCVEQFALLGIPEKSDNQVIKPPPTLEDLIREIVRTEMGAAQ